MDFQECNNQLAYAIGILHQAEQEGRWPRDKALPGFWEQIEAHREDIADRMNRAGTLGLAQEVALFREALEEAQIAERNYLEKRLTLDDVNLLPFKARLEQAALTLRERMRELASKVGIVLGGPSSRNWSRGHGR